MMYALLIFGYVENAKKKFLFKSTYKAIKVGLLLLEKTEKLPPRTIKARHHVNILNNEQTLFDSSETIFGGLPVYNF